MKKMTMMGITMLFIFFIVSRLSTISAQGMMGYFNSSSDNTAIQSQQQEEREGKKLLDDLNNKKVTCSQLKDADFEKMGEYFMGQSIGNTQRHIRMNGMMKRMMGEKGEEQAHQAMGKRLSACNNTAAFPSQDAGFLPMMGMMGSAFALGFGETKWGGGLCGIFGVITWILIIVFLIVGIIYFLRGLNRKK